MGFNFPIISLIFLSFKKDNGEALREILYNTTARSELVEGLTSKLPPNCQWCTFLRNHDELTLEMVNEAERQWMWEQYAPQPEMRLNLGIRRRLAPLLDNDVRKISLAFTLLYALPGSPIIYYGDEIGMGDDLSLFDRNGVRTPMQWLGVESAGFSEAIPASYYAPVIHTSPYDPYTVNVEDQQADRASLFHKLKQLNHVRKENPAFGLGSFTWLDVSPPAVAVFLRSYQEVSILALHNLSSQEQRVSLPLETSRYKDLLDGVDFQAIHAKQLTISLAPYQVRWLKGV